MDKYKILFVDEVAADIRRFQRYVHKNDTEGKFELITKTPENTLENFLDEIKGENFDAIITDHKLHEENANITFDGIELVRAINSIKSFFPCFVLTSFDDEAVENGDDVNIVYVKGIMDPLGESKSHATFLFKIENQIKHYKKKILEAEEKLDELINLSHERDLSAAEEEKLLEYEKFIENTTDKKVSIPKHIKERETLDKIHHLIENTDKLLETLNKDSNESS
jgi:hypothetical protein